MTGGSRGIGGVVVKKMLQCDMHVIIGKPFTMTAELIIEDGAITNSQDMLSGQGVGMSAAEANSSSSCAVKA